MGQTTVLSTGKITASDSLTVELVEPSDMPPTIRMRWPTQPSITEPYRFPRTANAIMGIMAAAIAQLATIRESDI